MSLQDATAEVWFLTGSQHLYGQETLDRVLSHPGLELYALGSDVDVNYLLATRRP